MKQYPDHDVMEHRIRQMAESLEPPESLSPDRMLQKLPDRPAAGRLILLRKYAPAVAAAACLLVVLAGTAALRGFTGEPLIQPHATPSTGVESSVPQFPFEPEKNSTSAGDEEKSMPANELPREPQESEERDSSPSMPEEPAEFEPSIESPGANGSTPAPAAPPTDNAAKDASLTEESSADTPPGARDLSHLALQAGETFESYHDVYSAMEEARRAVQEQQQANSSPLVLASMKVPSLSTIVQNVNTGGTVVTNNRAICTISDNTEEPSVLIYTPDGKNTAWTAELKPSFFLPDIEGMHVNYLSISQLLLEDNTLIIAGNAYYWEDRTNERQNLSVFSFYDISNPSNPVYLSTLCQDGDLSAAYLNDGALCLITKYKVPAGRELTEENLTSYLPYAYDNGQAIIPRRNQIQLSEKAAEPVYTFLSTIDLSDVTNFADTYCYFGGINGLLVNDQFVCLTGTYDEPAQLMLRSFELTSSGIEPYDARNLEGVLCGEVYMLPKSRGLAAALQDENGNFSFYLLDKKMQIQGALENFAPSASISGVQYDGFFAYFLNDSGKIIATADCSSMRSPKLLRQSPDSLPSAVQTVPFGSYSIRMDYLLDESGLIAGATLGMYDSSGNSGPVLLHSTEITGDLYIPAMYDSSCIFADEHSGVIGFALTRYSNGESGYTASCSYLLFQYSETSGFNLLTEQPLENLSNGVVPEYQPGLLSRGVFYVALPDRVLALNPQNGKLLADVSAIK